jgi:hypothetical protein
MTCWRLRKLGWSHHKVTIANRLITGFAQSMDFNSSSDEELSFEQKRQLKKRAVEAASREQEVISLQSSDDDSDDGEIATLRASPILNQTSPGPKHYNIPASTPSRGANGRIHSVKRKIQCWSTHLLLQMRLRVF